MAQEQQPEKQGAIQFLESVKNRYQGKETYKQFLALMKDFSAQKFVFSPLQHHWMDIRFTFFNLLGDLTESKLTRSSLVRTSSLQMHPNSSWAFNSSYHQTSETGWSLTTARPHKHRCTSHKNHRGTHFKLPLNRNQELQR